MPVKIARVISALVFLGSSGINMIGEEWIADDEIAEKQAEADAQREAEEKQKEMEAPVAVPASESGGAS